MKRGRKTTAIAVLRKSQTALPKGKQAELARLVERLTTRFLLLKEQLQRDAVETIREMGAILQQGSELLPGVYTRWLADDLGISQTAASNYRRVFELSESTPGVFVEHKELGPSKMFRLARIEGPKRKRALAVKINGKTAMRMTDSEFAVATQPFVRKSRPVTNNMRAHGLRMKVQALTAFLHEGRAFVPDRKELKAGLRGDLDALVRAAASLRKALC